jgi:D-threo-aldose 1-dehydrogenase
MDVDYNKDKIVLGTAGLAGVWGEVDVRESVRTILMALDLGISRFDTAPAYADAEELLATALGEWTGKKPFISTKVGKLRSNSPDEAHYDYSPSMITKSVERSLKLFRLDTLDLVFLHDPGSVKAEEIEQAIETLVVLQGKGLIQQIGIGGNFGTAFEGYSVSGVFSHFMGYNRYNLIRQTAAREEHERLRQSGVEIWQASPLYMGLLGRKFHDYLSGQPSWIPEEDLVRAREMKTELNKLGHEMAGVALNYVFNSPSIDKMVIGASNSSELGTTLEYLDNAVLKEVSDRYLERDRIR